MKDDKSQVSATSYSTNKVNTVNACVTEKEVWLGYDDFPPIEKGGGRSAPSPSSSERTVRVGCPRAAPFSYADRVRAVGRVKEEEKKKDKAEHLIFCKEYFGGKSKKRQSKTYLGKAKTMQPSKQVFLKEKETSCSFSSPPPPSAVAVGRTQSQNVQAEKEKIFSFSDPKVVEILSSDDECDVDVDVGCNDDDDDVYDGLVRLFRTSKRDKSTRARETKRREEGEASKKKEEFTCNNLNAAVCGYEGEEEYLHSKFYIKGIKLAGKKINAAFIDSGSDVDIIPEKCARAAGIDLEKLPRAPPLSLSSYSKHKIETKFSVWADLQLPNLEKPIKHLFLIANTDSELVVLSKHLLVKYSAGLQKRKKGWFLTIPYLTKAEGKNETEKENNIKLKRQHADSDQVACRAPSSSSSSYLLPCPKPKKGERVGKYYVPVVLRNEQKTEVEVVNAESLRIKAYETKPVPVSFPSLIKGTPIQKRIQILPGNDYVPVVYVPVLASICSCAEKCNRYIALAKNTSCKDVFLKKGELKGRSQSVPSNTMCLTVEQANTLANVENSELGKREVDIFSLQVNPDRGSVGQTCANDFDLKKCDEHLFEETSSFGLLDEEAGLPVDPPFLKNAADAFNWKEYDPHVAATLHEIFFEQKRETLIARSKMDIGNASSRGLGKLRLLSKEKPKKTGPKIYPMSNSGKVQLMKILQGLMALQLIKRVSASTHGSPCFLIERKEGGMARLLINMANTNSTCVPPPTAVMTSPLKLINSLGGKWMFSKLDLNSCYYHLRVEEESAYKNAVINTPLGSYAFLAAPQGGATVPAVWSACLQRIISDDPITGSLQTYNMPEKYRTVPYERNPFAPLSTFIFYWLDDLCLATVKFDTYEETFEFHKIILCRLLDHLKFFDLRLAIKKCQFFRTEMDILGYTVRDGTITPDTKRFESIKKATFPKTRNLLQSFMGLVNCVRHVLPITVHENLSKLYSLTSAKQQYKPDQTHRQAFEEVKKELLSEQLVTYLPDNRKMKILFTDASTVLYGGVLLEVDLDGPIHTMKRADIPSKPFSIFDAIGRKLYKHCDGTPVRMSKSPIPSDGDCFYASVLDQLRLYGVKSGYADNVQDFRILITNYLKCSEKLRVESAPVRKAFGYSGWHAYADDLAKDKTPTDQLGLVIQATADFLARDIIIVTSLIDQKDPLHIKSNTKTVAAPPLFLGLYVANSDSEIGHYISLVVEEKNALTGEWTSLDGTRLWRELSKEEIFEQIKQLWGKINLDKRPNVRVLGFYTKSISESDRKEPIYLLELRSLLFALHEYREYIQSAPACAVLIDSRALYCILNSTITTSILKVHRWGVSLREKYNNLLFYLVKSGENAADFLSRQFFPVGFSPQKLYLRKDFKAGLSELETGKLVTLDEAADLVQRNPQYLNDCTSPSPPKAKSTDCVDGTSTVCGLTANLDRLSEAVLPIKELEERLRPDKLIPLQKQELSEIYTIALTVPEDKQEGDFKYSLVNGVLTVRTPSSTVPTIYAPPSCYGLIIAYYHMRTFHRLHSAGLHLTIKEIFYIPNLRTLCKHFAELCLNCTLINPNKSRKETMGRHITPSSPMQIIFIDVVTLGSRQDTVHDYLTVTCVFSKYVQIYPCKRVNDTTVIKWLMHFFSHMGIVKYIFADNAKYFRSRKILTFLSHLGIKMAYSTPYRSSARGAVEIQNYLVRKLLSSIVLTKSSYSIEETLFLATLALNNSKQVSTSLASPSQIVFGRETLPFQLRLNEPILSSSLVNSSLATDVKRLRESLDIVWKDTVSKIEKAKQKRENYFNKKAINKDYKVGELVFVLDRTLPPPGASKKLSSTLFKSPFMVTEVFSKVLTVSRLVDKYSIRVAFDDVKKLRDMDPEDPLFIALPNSVRTELGRPITNKQIQDLAKIDQLPLILRDNLYRYSKREAPPMETRAAKQKREREQQEIEDAFQEAENLNIDDALIDGSDDDIDDSEDTVRFNIPSND